MKPLHSTKRRLQWRRSRTLAELPPAAVAANDDRSPRAMSPLPPYEWPSLLDHTREPAFVHDRDHRILRCNQAYAAAAGLPMSEIVGRPYWRVLPRLDAAPPPCEVGEPAAEDTPSFTAEDGRIFKIHETGTPCPQGNFWYCRHLLEDVTASNVFERELEREKAVLKDILDCAPSAFYLVDQDARLVRWNSYVRDRTGLADEELRGASVLSLIHENDRSLASAKLLSAFATGYAQMEVRIGSDENGPRYFLSTARRIIIEDEPYVAGFCIETTARKRAEKEVEEQKLFDDMLVENVPGIFFVLDDEGNCLRWNSNVNKLTGLTDRELYKRSALLTLMEEDRTEAARRLKEAFEKGYARAVLRIPSKERGVRSILMTGRRFEMNGASYLAGVGIDTTDQAESIRALEQAANTDSLTQIANRGCFLNHAGEEFARCRRYGHPLSVWMLDLDHFKSVNDAHGHQAGDAVLRAVVDTTRETLRDWDFVGRMGGEEFAVLLPETDGQQALQVAERLRRAVARLSIRVDAKTVATVTVSIGIACARSDDEDAHALLSRADAALYEAKNTGRDKVCLA